MLIWIIPKIIPVVVCYFLFKDNMLETLPVWVNASANILIAGLMNLRKKALPTASKLCFGNLW